MSRDQIGARTWFGGPLPPAARARLGDVALIPHEPVAFLDPADSGDIRLLAATDPSRREEMLVPSVARRWQTRIVDANNDRTDRRTPGDESSPLRTEVLDHPRAWPRSEASARWSATMVTGARRARANRSSSRPR